MRGEGLLDIPAAMTDIWENVAQDTMSLFRIKVSSEYMMYTHNKSSIQNGWHSQPEPSAGYYTVVKVFASLIRSARARRMSLCVC